MIDVFHIIIKLLVTKVGFGGVFPFFSFSMEDEERPVPFNHLL